METMEKVTTVSEVSVNTTNDHMVTIAAIDLKHDHDGCFYGKKKINKNTQVNRFVQ